MEKELKALEDQIIEIRNNTSEQVTEEKRHIESLHSHEQVLKSKVRHYTEYVNCINEHV